MALGPHKIEYEVIEGWEQMPEGWSFIEVVALRATRRTACTCSTAASIR